jgi:hypothetical protein
MSKTRKVVALVLSAFISSSVAGAWTVQQMATWTQVTRSGGQVGWVMPNGYHLYSNNPDYDQCIWDSEDSELECQRDNCTNVFPPAYQKCIQDCHDVYLSNSGFCHTFYDVLINNGSDPTDGFPD